MVERQSIEFMASPPAYVARSGGSCCGRALRNPSKSNAVAVLRFHRGERVRRLTRCLDARLTTSAAVLSLYTRGTPRAVRVDAARRHSLSSRPSLR